MSVELAVAIKLGQALGAPAANLASKRFRTWQRLVAADAAKAVGFNLSRKRLRRALKARDGVAILTPKSATDAEVSIDYLLSQIGTPWKGLTEAAARARTIEVVEAAQRALLKRLGMPEALDLLDQRSAARDTRTQELVSEVATAVSRGKGLADALASLPPDLAERVGGAAEITPRVADLARAIAEASDPGSTLAEWADNPPHWLVDGPAANWTLLGDALASYGRAARGALVLETAVSLGVSEPGLWRAKSALYLRDSDASRARELVSASDSHPLARAVAHVLEDNSIRALEALEDWVPQNRSEADVKALLCASCLVHDDNDDGAAQVLEARLDSTKSASVPLSLARILVRRAYTGRATSRDAELQRAFRLALRARDLRRLWRGDSAEAVSVAADALALSHDWAAVWSHVRAQPEGLATLAESQDRRVIGKAAMAAAATGRSALARELAADVGPFDRAWIEAALAEDDGGDGGDHTVQDRSALLRLWQRAFDVAGNDEERLLAARGVIMAGGEVPGISGLKQRYPSALRDVEELADALLSPAGQSQTQVIAKLRGLRGSNLNAAVRLSEVLLQAGKTEEAATALREAADKFDDQQLRLIGASMLADAGLYALAATDASEALTRAGTDWSGRHRARLIVLVAASDARDWDEVIAQARRLLAEDQDHDEARWALAFALNAKDESAEAWSALHNAGQLLTAHDSQRAALRLSLIAQHGYDSQLIREAVIALRTYGSDERFAAYVLSLAYTGRRPSPSADAPDAIKTSVEASELAELHVETEGFFERFPDSPWFRRITFKDIEDLVAQMGEILRQGAAARQRFERDVAEGALPTGFLASITGHSYATAFLVRAGGGLRIQSASPEEAAQDRQAAYDLVGDDLRQAVITEASALHVVSLLDPALQRLLTGSFSLLHVTDASILDLRAARDAMALRSTLSTTYDVAEGRVVFIKEDEDTANERAERAQVMLALAQLASTLSTRAGKTDSEDERGFGPWLNVVEACKQFQSVLWSDDVALRRLARAEGVAGFGTLDLIAALETAARVPQGSLAEALLTFTRAFAVDLDPDIERLRVVAAADNWQPRAAAYFLSRAASWRSSRTCLALLREACQHNTSRPESIRGWLIAATHGAASAAPDPPSAIQNVSTLISGLALEPFSNPSIVREVVEGAKAGCRERLPDADPWATAVTLIHQALLRVHGEQAAAELLLNLSRNLEDDDRLAAVTAIVDGAR